MTLIVIFLQYSVADPGFPVGGRRPRRGPNSRGGYVLKILYVKTKKSGPLGGLAPDTPPRSAKGIAPIYLQNVCYLYISNCGTPSKIGVSTRCYN